MSLLDYVPTKPPRLKHPLTCPGCATSIVAPTETFHLGQYLVHRCGFCSSTITDPLPSAEVIAAHYATYNETYSAGMGSERYQREMPKRWNARLDVIQRRGGAGRLLDLAGSNGMFGSLAHARGFEVSVADFISEPKDLGFTVALPANLNEHSGVPFGDASFDVVTLWSCIEHVSNPDTCLAETYRLVRPGGIVAIDTPLIGDVCERLFPASSHWLCPPEHLHCFSALGLSQAVARAGFEVILCSPFFERTPGRWLARRGRNVAVATQGLLTRLAGRGHWERARGSRTTQAGDIQVLLARRPNNSGE